MYRWQRFYKDFRKAVKKRTVMNMAVPVSGGLDSTLIAKAIVDNKDKDKCTFFCIGKNKYVDAVSRLYGLNVHYFEAEAKKEDYKKIIEILEEPFYSKNITYYLYKEICKHGLRVSMSGLGADELFGGYDYYNTSKYPRGLFKEIIAASNEEKKKHDSHFLIHHHLRENEKIGLYWQVEGRYPYLSKELRKYREDIGKSLIKDVLLMDFSMNFVYRKKEGFRANNITDRTEQKKEYNKQLRVWKKIFNQK